MKALVALLLLAIGAGSVWAYGMMGGGMMGRSADGGSGDLWGYMASMHNWMHGTDYTADSFREAMQGWIRGGEDNRSAISGGMMGGYGMMGGAGPNDDDDGPGAGSFGCR